MGFTVTVKKMLKRLKKHPFAVEAYFEYSLVLTYAYEASALASKIPPGLELDLYKDRWAFVAVAMVQTRNLRPKRFPRFLGRDFFLAGYRIFVRYRTASGQGLRGLYILRSETNKLQMKLLGNVFTKYNYSRVNLTATESENQMNIHVPESDFKVTAKTQSDKDCPLPAGSPFENWMQARMFAGPMPFTFSVDGDKMTIVEGVRENWKPQGIEVLEHRVPYLKEITVQPPQLANAFITRKIPYAWKKGRTETLQI